MSLRADPDGGLKVIATFDKVDGLSDVKYEIAAGGILELNGQPSASGASFTFSSVSVPVKVTYLFKGKSCTVTGRATITGSAYLKPAGC